MTAREWLSATWAEWCPSCSNGRLEVGRLVIQTRRAQSRMANDFIEIGRRQVLGDPHPASTVRHLTALKRPT